MEKFSRIKRHRIYKRALKIYKKGTCKWRGIYCEVDGLCRAIYLANKNQSEIEGTIADPFNAFNHRYTKKNADASFYPEILKHKPLVIAGMGYWFEIDDKESRIKILEQAIEETKFKMSW